MKPYASKLQKEEGLSSTEKQNLVKDCVKVANSEKYFEGSIKPFFHFFDNAPLPIEQTLLRIESAFSRLNPKDPGYNVYEEVLKDHNAFKRVETTLKDTKKVAGQDIKRLSDKIDIASGVSLEFIKELASMTKTTQEKIAKQERELSNIGSKVISTYWHSEQKLLHYIEVSTASILDELFKKTLEFKPGAILINIHSRHDICSVCSHTIALSYTQPGGVLYNFKAALCKRLQITDSKTFPLYITSSFREERTKLKYKIEQEALGDLELFEKERFYPAFPTLYVPITHH